MVTVAGRTKPTAETIIPRRGRRGQNELARHRASPLAGTSSCQAGQQKARPKEIAREIAPVKSYKLTTRQERHVRATYAPHIYRGPLARTAERQKRPRKGANQGTHGMHGQVLLQGTGGFRHKDCPLVFICDDFFRSESSALHHVIAVLWLRGPGSELELAASRSPPSEPSRRISTDMLSCLAVHTGLRSSLLRKVASGACFFLELRPFKRSKLRHSSSSSSQPLTVFILDQIYDKCTARVLERSSVYQPSSHAGHRKAELQHRRQDRRDHLSR